MAEKLPKLEIIELGDGDYRAQPKQSGPRWRLFTKYEAEEVIRRCEAYEGQSKHLGNTVKAIDLLLNGLDDDWAKTKQGKKFIKFAEKSATEAEQALKEKL